MRFSRRYAGSMNLPSLPRKAGGLRSMEGRSKASLRTPGFRPAEIPLYSSWASFARDAIARAALTTWTVFSPALIPISEPLLASFAATWPGSGASLSLWNVTIWLEVTSIWFLWGTVLRTSVNACSLKRNAYLRLAYSDGLVALRRSKPWSSAYPYIYASSCVVYWGVNISGVGRPMYWALNKLSIAFNLYNYKLHRWTVQQEEIRTQFPQRKKRRVALMMWEILRQCCRSLATRRKDAGSLRTIRHLLREMGSTHRIQDYSGPSRSNQYPTRRLWLMGRTSSHFWVVFRRHQPMVASRKRTWPRSWPMPTGQPVWLAQHLIIGRRPHCTQGCPNRPRRTCMR